MSLDHFVNEFEKRFCVIHTVSVFKHFLNYKFFLKGPEIYIFGIDC
jgi:hypothetical protein